MNTMKKMMNMMRRFFLVVLCAASVAGTTGTPVLAAEAPKKISDYRCWAQDDPRWSSVRLGSSSLTIRDAGCAVIAYDKLLIQAGIKDDSFTPADMVSWMVSNGKFGTGKQKAQVGSWKGMASISDRISYVEQKKAPSKEDLMNYLGKGYFVILRVTLKTGGTHFVVVANKASNKKGRPLIWNCVKGVSSSKKLYEQYNLNKDPYSSFRSVDSAIVYKVSGDTGKKAGTAGNGAASEAEAPASTAQPIALESPYLPSGTLAEGSAFTMGGTVTAGTDLTYVGAYVSDRSGNIRFSSSAEPCKKSFCLQSLDSGMKFSGLEEGSYMLVIEAADAAGCERFEYPFSVRSSSVRSAGDCTAPKGTLKKGSAFSCKGTVSGGRIVRVTMSVYSAAGRKMFAASAKPGTKSYDLHELDSEMTFRKLPAGTYTYRAAVEDENGTVRYVVSRTFKVR